MSNEQDASPVSQACEITFQLLNGLPDVRDDFARVVPPLVFEVTHTLGDFVQGHGELASFRASTLEGLEILVCFISKISNHKVVIFAFR